MGADYTDRGLAGTDDGCPYEFTVTGLANNVLYRFAVRAEDGTAGAAAPNSGFFGGAGSMKRSAAESMSAHGERSACNDARRFSPRSSKRSAMAT